MDDNTPYPGLRAVPSDPFSRPQHTEKNVVIQAATPKDADTIKQITLACYAKYVGRIGREPAPMTADYHALVADDAASVWMLRERDSSRGVGSIILYDSPGDDSLLVDNLIVDPAVQGRGYGRLLMGFAEDVARERGWPALTLFTNEKMYENLALYPKMGFVVVDRRVENGYHRVYFRKTLAPVVPS